MIITVSQMFIPGPSCCSRVSMRRDLSDLSRNKPQPWFRDHLPPGYSTATFMGICTQGYFLLIQRILLRASKQAVMARSHKEGPVGFLSLS